MSARGMRRPVPGSDAERVGRDLRSDERAAARLYAHCALIGRMTSRRQCPHCSRVYNLLHEPPRLDGVCDDDGTALITRKDDQEHIFRERLRTYEDVTRPVLAYYHSHVYHQIRGDRSPAYIFEEITAVLEKSLNGGSLVN